MFSYNRFFLDYINHTVLTYLTMVLLDDEWIWIKLVFQVVLLSFLKWQEESLKVNPAASRSLQDLKASRRSGAERTLIHSLPTIKLSQWGFPDNTVLADYSSPGPGPLWTWRTWLATSLPHWLLAYHKPVTSPVAPYQLQTSCNHCNVMINKGIITDGCLRVPDPALGLLSKD